MTPSLMGSGQRRHETRPSRDRLQAFQRLFLGLALFLVAGLTAVLGFERTTGARYGVLLALAALTLSAYWLDGYRRGRFPLALVPLEATLLGFVMAGMTDEVASLGISYVVIQFRALYGPRRDAALTIAAFIAVYIVVLQRVPVLDAIAPAVMAIEIAVLAVCGVVMHGLAEVLVRDREHAETLRRSEDRYRSIFDHNPFPMWLVDIETLAVRDANQAAADQYGYSREEFLGMSIRQLRPESQLESFDKLVPMFQSEQRLQHHVVHRRRDGSVFDVELTSQIMDFGGETVRVAVAVDVSDRTRALRALRESEERFRAVAENLREALLITDRDDRIILANSRVRDVLGYEPDDVIGRFATELLLPAEQASAFADRLERRLSGQVELYEVELIRKDGARITAEVSASPYRDMAGNVIGTLGAISDITEQKQLEERLRQATHMEAVGQLAGGVAHDFNNLLTVINCHAELLLTDKGQPDTTRESAAEISRAAQRGATLTAQLLAFSRRQMLQPRRIVLADIVAGSVSALRRLAHDGVSIAATDDGLRAEVNADPRQIQQVLESLVRNASEAIGGAGRITIDTRRARGTELPGDTALAETPADHYIVLSVTDTGVGMSESVRAHLFEPFFTTKGPGEGTGLGLASVYGIVRQSGGLLDVESVPSVGTTFRIYLPAIPAEPAQLRAPTLSPATPPRIARANGAR